MIKPLYFTKQAANTVSDAALIAAKLELGVSLPAAFAEFCQIYNGGYPADQNNFYLVPESYHDFHNEYPAGKGVSVDGLFGLTQEFKSCDVVRAHGRLHEQSRIALFPIGYDLFGNHIVVLAQKPDGLVFWCDHELWTGPDEPVLFPIADNLHDYYNELCAMK